MDRWKGILDRGGTETNGASQVTCFFSKRHCHISICLIIFTPFVNFRRKQTTTNTSKSPLTYLVGVVECVLYLISSHAPQSSNFIYCSLTLMMSFNCLIYHLICSVCVFKLNIIIFLRFVDVLIRATDDLAKEEMVYRSRYSYILRLWFLGQKKENQLIAWFIYVVLDFSLSIIVVFTISRKVDACHYLSQSHYQTCNNYNC